MTARKILLVAGGTGGHIMPAISFGRWASEKRGAEVGYVCGSRAMEREIYSCAGIDPKIISLEGSPLSGGISVKMRVVRTFAAMAAFAQAWKILKGFRPDCCILFGGYVSLPFLLLCKAMKIPAAVHEQNACAGMVTKLAVRTGTPVLSGWDACFPLDGNKFKRVGVPVRGFKKTERVEALKSLGLPGSGADSFIVVVFSGSLGSISIKKKICEISERECFKNWLFLIPSVSENTEKILSNVWLLPKIWEPSPLFAAADAVITRAGGSILTEIAVLGLPALVIPWRGAANDHQYYNAYAFISENTGIILDLDNDSALLAKKVFALKKLVGDCSQKKVSKLYNEADEISEKLWESSVSLF